MKNIFLMLAFCLCLLPGYLMAADAKIEAEWTWNGTDQTVEGFRFYLDGEMVQDATGADTRISTWDMPLENGKHDFSLTAYGTDADGVAWESTHSPTYTFEYLNVEKEDGRPAPTVYIRIN